MKQRIAYLSLLNKRVNNPGNSHPPVGVLLQQPLLLTCWMRLRDVNHQKICDVTEIPDELLELLKFEHKRGSGATSEIQHQRSVPCGRQQSQTQRGTNQPDAEEPRRDAPFINSPIDVLFFPMVTTGESGASCPTKASWPRDNHMWWDAVFTKAIEVKVKPQSSYLNLGFWVMVTFSPSLRMIFLARAGETSCKVQRTPLSISM